MPSCIVQCTCIVVLGDIHAKYLLNSLWEFTLLLVFLLEVIDEVKAMKRVRKKSGACSVMFAD